MIRPSVKNKIVVVTGAASGIGASISKTFSRQGATIGMLDKDEKGVKAAAAELAGAGMTAVGLACDVSDENQCAKAIGEIIDRYGGIDILVNNAGITQRSAFVDTRLSVYRKVMEVNFFGSLHCTRFAIQSLIARRGMIIIIESIAGLAPLLGRTAYCASKHALHGLFTSLRSELRARGVHVMIVCPGFVKTNLQNRALGGDGQVTTHPQSRVGKQDSPDRIAEAVYRGSLKQKKLLVLSPIGKLTHWINRLTPGIYERIMTRQLKEELIRNGYNASGND
jgi:NAD(P)-dependent dehydrogenase (short-subunit alcohol dehydrogenase family)